jgi:helix-turn-helix protein
MSAARPQSAEPLRPRLTVRDLAAILRRSPRTIQKWNRLGKMPPCHILPDGDSVWDPRDVEKWLESRKG